MSVLNGSPASMQIREARERYVRWLAATRDLSPHTLRAYDGDIAAFERFLEPSRLVGQLSLDPPIPSDPERRMTS